jgi:hypothetical protein
MKAGRLHRFQALEVTGSAERTPAATARKVCHGHAFGECVEAGAGVVGANGGAEVALADMKAGEAADTLRELPSQGHPRVSRVPGGIKVESPV